MGFRDLTSDETATVLQKERVIRLSFASEGETFVVPVFYVWKDGALCGMTTPGRKTRMAMVNPHCGFQVDSSATTGPFEWASVSGEGEIELLDDPAEQMSFAPQLGERLADAPPWAQELLQQRFATLGRIGWRLRPTVMSGRGTRAGELAVSRLIQISQVSTSAIADEIRACLRPDLDAERIGEFLSAVDWTDMGRADSTVLRWLGELEALSTAFAEADLTRDEYISRLQDYVNPVARAV